MNRSLKVIAYVQTSPRLSVICDLNLDENFLLLEPPGAQSSTIAKPDIHPLGQLSRNILGAEQDAVDGVPGAAKDAPFIDGAAEAGGTRLDR